MAVLPKVHIRPISLVGSPCAGTYDNVLGRINFSSPGGVPGRYVVVQRMSDANGVGQMLELADVQVFVRPLAEFPFKAWQTCSSSQGSPNFKTILI